MPDHRDLLERRAERGAERGPDAVLDAARRQPLAPSDPPVRRPRQLVLAAALAILVLGGAVAVGVARTRSTDVVVGATTDVTAEATPWMLPAELPAGTHLQWTKTEPRYDAVPRGYVGRPPGDIVILGSLGADGRLTDGIAVSRASPDELSSLHYFPQDLFGQITIEGHPATYTPDDVGPEPSAVHFPSMVVATTDSGTVRATSWSASGETLIALVAAVLGDSDTSAAELAAIAASPGIVYDGPDSAVFINAPTHTFLYSADGTGEPVVQLQLARSDFDPRSALMWSPDAHLEGDGVVTTIGHSPAPTTTRLVQPGLIASVQGWTSAPGDVDELIFGSLAPTTQTELDQAIAAAPERYDETTSQATATTPELTTTTTP